MKHVTFADKSLLVGDDVADMMLTYSARLASANVGDTVEVHAISSDGDEVTATFQLGEGAPLMTETTSSKLPEPENGAALEQMTNRMARLTPTGVEADAEAENAALDDLYNES